MMTLRAAWMFGLFAILGTKLTTCRSPGESGSDAAPGKTEVKDVNLPGIDTSALTAREKSEWSYLVSERLAPCPDQPVSVAKCVSESRPCRACVPAAGYLVDQVRAGRTRSQAEAAYQARFSADKIRNIELQDSPSKGPSDAPVLIVEFADFECPFCGAVKPVVDSLFEKFPGKVRLVFKEFPLSMHQNAEGAARAAVAAQKQGKFWEMHGLLFENQTTLDSANIERLAQKAGLNLEQFKKDVASEAVADAVARDRKQGEALDLQGTPSIFINGRLFPTGQDFEQDIEAWIKLEIELVTGGASPAPTKAPAPASSVVAPAPSAAPAAAPSAAPSAKPKSP
ncbi:MAG TPA: thioredoxin domain-containing protein [Polyangiaceae bacterium]|jgi:protein-disulfide isomerase|nr:thioredoxin domain-containing protein [Polyangiaceae bacterium]